jgi:Ala-tRNA(Pro) deacylase
MSEAEFERIKKIFEDAGAQYEVFEHEPVRTSAEAAQVREQGLEVGVKALVVKFKRQGKEFFVVIDVPAHKKLDWKKAKKILQASEVNFAKENEVVEQTGCEPGGVPPFGHKNKLAVLVDPKIFEQDFLEFNAGLKTKSVRVGSKQLKKALDAIGAAYFDLVEE